jgi:hypothetical protein
MPTSIEVVNAYLQLCEDRMLAEASTYLAPNILMIFPGGKTYHSLEEMIAGAKGRYSWVKKNRTDFDSLDNGNESSVISRGTLFGEDLDGQPFTDIRYIDFFVLKNHKIVEQHVWNDLAELGITHKN